MIHWEFALRTPLAKAAGWAILHSLWETAAVAAVLAGALAVLRTARARCLAACGALCAVLLAFALTAVMYLPWESKSSAFQSPDGLAWRIVRSDRNFRQTSWPALEIVLPWLTPFWAAGMILCYARCLMSWTAAQRLRRTGLCAVPDAWREKLNSLRARLRLARPVALFESCLAEVPSRSVARLDLRNSTVRRRI
jgi:bla regulator protein BlaR1